MALKRLSSVCMNCPEKDKCKSKRMELCEYLEQPKNIASSVSMPSVADMVQPMSVSHDYRDVKVGENTTITIDVEELKRQMEKEIYKSAGIGLNYGA